MKRQKKDTLSQMESKLRTLDEAHAYHKTRPKTEKLVAQLKERMDRLRFEIIEERRRLGK